MSDNRIRIGDVVQLRGGGCLMTVQGVGRRDQVRPIACVWFDDDGAHRAGEFAVEALRRVIVDDSPLIIEL